MQQPNGRGDNLHDPLPERASGDGPEGENRLIFAPEQPAAEEPERLPWKVLISDDDESVHAVTRMVLSGFSFEGRPLLCLSARSAEETRRMLREHSDIAVCLLDVVMEEGDSGLRLVRFIREEQENRLMRIILRTGQPGQAPERDVIVTYDINDYKEKTELTVQKLFTAVVASLRSYRDLLAIETSRKGLERIIEATAGLFELSSLRRLGEGVLLQISALLGMDEGQPDGTCMGFMAVLREGRFDVLARLGECPGEILLWSDLPSDVRGQLLEVRARGGGLFFDRAYAGYLRTSQGTELLLHVRGWHPIREMDKNLIRLFTSNVAVALDNIELNQEIVATQKEIIYTLGEVVESRSKETVHHVRRVGLFAALLGRQLGLPEEEVELLKLASPMHDVGKIGIPDSILSKPGFLSPEEFETIKTHPLIGHEILKKSSRKILRTAAVIALEHHERWDGTGYPRGLAGEEIQLYGRVVALADVFDALAHRRAYKEAWTPEEIWDYLRSMRGTQFDPTLVDLFLESREEAREILEAFPEP
jgi:response regulator RpfG family c-di-GMP phosphodiesterase